MKPKLKFLLDYGSSPLWSTDKLTSDKFGYNINNLKELGISDNTILLANFVTEIFLERLNPIYPILPSFWSGEMMVFYQSKIKELYNNICSEIGEQYEIVNHSQEELNMTIDIKKINTKLEEFLFDPAKYYREHNITFIGTDEEEKMEAEFEYQKWKRVERQLLLEK